MMCGETRALPRRQLKKIKQINSKLNELQKHASKLGALTPNMSMYITLSTSLIIIYKVKLDDSIPETELKNKQEELKKIETEGNPMKGDIQIIRELFRNLMEKVK